MPGCEYHNTVRESWFPYYTLDYASVNKLVNTNGLTQEYIHRIQNHTYFRVFCTNKPATIPMVVGRLAAHTPSLFRVFSSVPVATINGGAHYNINDTGTLLYTETANVCMNSYTLVLYNVMY